MTDAITSYQGAHQAWSRFLADHPQDRPWSEATWSDYRRVRSERFFAQAAMLRAIEIDSLRKEAATSP
jgi:hypothetical protein